MDNLSSHQDPAIRRALRRACAKLFYLAKYSPELNRIEQVVKLKTLLRKANARSFAAVEAAALMKAITPIQCRNFFVEAEYAATYCKDTTL